MIDGMRTGFMRDSSGNRLLPITHINLVIGDIDGKSIQDTFKEWNAIISEIGNSSNVSNGNVLSVNTYEEMLSLDTAKLNDGAICYVSEKETYYSYTTNNGWNIMVTDNNGNSGSQEDIYSHIWIGPDPPENENMIWLDTNNDGIIETPDDISLLYQLRDQIIEMQTTINILNARVKYLEENGVVINPDPTPTPTPDEYDILLLEDDTPFLLEDGTDLLLEIQSIPPIESNENTLLFEDGTEILLEDGTALLLE